MIQYNMDRFRLSEGKIIDFSQSLFMKDQWMLDIIGRYL